MQHATMQVQGCTCLSSASCPRIITCEACRQCVTSACSSPIVRAMRSRRLKLGAAREGAFHGGGGSLLLLPASLPLSPAARDGQVSCSLCGCCAHQGGQSPCQTEPLSSVLSRPAGRSTYLQRWPHAAWMPAAWGAGRP